ncbi:MAG: acetyltransferase [Moraxellaceae bacterium]|nr:acetyltransferase [Moraxellaceae bacterium]
MKNIVILGAGGFGREVHAWLQHYAQAGNEVSIKGFLDDNAAALDGIVGLPPIIGGMRDYSLVPGDILLSALGGPRLKLELYEYWKAKGAFFMTLIHPTAVIGQRVEIGEGSVLCPGVIVTADVAIGNMVTLNAASSVGHDAVIGDGCTLSGHADVTGYAQLGSGCFLGSHAVVTPNMRVGANAIVGAGSVVVRNVPDGATVFGVPAKQIAGFQD